MSDKVKLKVQCDSCSGTGLYVGMAETDGAAVVCHQCHGKGYRNFEYTPFDKNRQRNGIRRVFLANPGIRLRDDPALGGLPYAEWLNGRKFGLGTEPRSEVCPAWYYQAANCSLKPDWDECMSSNVFSQCRCFNNKEKCWKRFDKQIREPLD